ncbi:hypothetical protein Tco_0444058, partial [Tanacetum coccineum]
EKQSSLVEGLSSYPPLPTQGSTSAGNTPVNTLGVGPNPPPPTQEANAPAGNAPCKPSYATATGKLSGKKVTVRTLYTPIGNGIDVVVLVDSIRAISE